MANPFSGLENIGQSYLQGVQLANQRQAREEATAQRAEETRMRGQYYQDLVDQRREAAALLAQGRTDETTRRTAADLLAAKQRDDTLGLKFGKSLVRDAKGNIDLIASAAKLEESESQNKFYETAGLAAALGKPLEGIDEKITRTKAYQSGVAQGLVENLKNETTLQRVLASQGIIPAGDSRAVPIPTDLESNISGAPRDNIFGIMGGGSEPIMTTLDVLGEGIPENNVPEMIAKAPARTATQEIPEGYQLKNIGGGKMVYMKIPKTSKADRPVFVKTVKVKDAEGNETEMKYTKEEVDAGLDRLVAPPGLPASTNAAPVGRLSYDKNAPFGAVYTPLKY